VSTCSIGALSARASQQKRMSAKKAARQCFENNAKIINKKTQPTKEETKQSRTWLPTTAAGCCSVRQEDE